MENKTTLKDLSIQDFKSIFYKSLFIDTKEDIQNLTFKFEHMSNTFKEDSLDSEFYFKVIPTSDGSFRRNMFTIQDFIRTVLNRDWIEGDKSYRQWEYNIENTFRNTKVKDSSPYKLYKSIITIFKELKYKFLEDLKTNKEVVLIDYDNNVAKMLGAAPLSFYCNSKIFKDESKDLNSYINLSTQDQLVFKVSNNLTKEDEKKAFDTLSEQLDYYVRDFFLILQLKPYLSRDYSICYDFLLSQNFLQLWTDLFIKTLVNLDRKLFVGFEFEYRLKVKRIKNYKSLTKEQSQTLLSTIIEYITSEDIEYNEYKNFSKSFLEILRRQIRNNKFNEIQNNYNLCKVIIKQILLFTLNRNNELFLPFTQSDNKKMKNVNPSDIDFNISFLSIFNTKEQLQSILSNPRIKECIERDYLN